MFYDILKEKVTALQPSENLLNTTFLKNGMGILCNKYKKVTPLQNSLITPIK